MGWFLSLFQSKSKKKNQEGIAFTVRQGKSVPIDDAFKAWTSGNLSKMLKAVPTKTNPIDRHFLLQSIVGKTYKLRAESKYRELCVEYSEKHIQEFPDIAPVLKCEMGGQLPRITTFQLYSTLLSARTGTPFSGKNLKLLPFLS